MKTKLNKNDSSNKELLDDMQLLTKKEVAGLFKVSTSTVDRWVRAGLLKFVKLGKNVKQARVYYHYSDVMEFKNSQYGFKIPNQG